MDFEVSTREQAARYGLNVEDVEDVIETAIGGKYVSQTVEGQERYPINVRYQRDLRMDIKELERVLVSSHQMVRRLPISL